MTLIFLTTIHVVLFYLPGFGTAFLLTSPNEKLSRCEFYGFVLVGACFFGYLAFWIYFWNTGAGTLYSIFVFLGSAILVLKRGKVYLNDFSLKFWHPVLASVLLAFFYLALGFLYGGLEHPLATARVRFSHPLPVDNELPLLFAGIVSDKNSLRPYIADWLTSDRPPLQTGITLLQFPVFGDLQKLQYQILGVVLQTSIGIGVWLLFSDRQFSEKDRVLIFLFLVFSNTLLVHSFYVWPKILPASLLMVGLALLQDARNNPDSSLRTIKGVFIGGAFAFAMLSHGGSVFAILPIGLVLLAARRLPPTRILLASAIAAVFLYLPWTGYQKFIDPPGNRLVKMHIGGSREIDDRSTLEVVIDSYSKLTFSQVLAKKAANFHYLFRSIDNLMRDFSSGEWATGIIRLRKEAFFRLSYALFIPALSTLVIPAKLVQQKPWSFSGAEMLVLIGFLGLMFWLLLMFGPPATVPSIHQGSLFIPIILTTGPFAFARKNMSWFAGLLLGLQAATFLLWIPFLPTETGNLIERSLLKNGFQPGFAGLALLSLIGLVRIRPNTRNRRKIKRSG